MKVQMIILLLVLFLVALLKNSGGNSFAMFFQFGTAILIAIAAEYAFFGAVKIKSIQSAIITGMIIGLLLVPGIDGKILWFTVVAAIASKALLKFPGGSHIFNPAAFGLLLACIFWGNKINWWGFSNTYIVIVLGGIILYRLNRLSFVFSYLIFRIAGIAVMNGLEINIEMIMLPNLFFAFIMLVEPMTTPAKRGTQWKFAASAGLLSSCSFALITAVDGDILALLVMNFLRPLLELHKKQ